MAAHVSETSPAKRPFRVSVLSVAFLLLAAAGWLRCVMALSNWSLLAELGVWPGPLYLVLGGAAWGVAGLPAGLSLWLRRRWSRLSIWIAAWFYILTFWLDRLFVTRSPVARTGWPFWSGMTLLWLGVVFIVMRSRATRSYLAHQ